MMPGLFEDDETIAPRREELAPGAVLLRGRALAAQRPLLTAIKKIIAQSPFRHMTTPGGFEMSVAMTNCGAGGWVADRSGYRYETVDPLTGEPWPPLPAVFLQLAIETAAEAGFANFVTDSCLINLYQPGAKMSLHQDKNEGDFENPIVSVSLGLPATFLFGGESRNDKPMRIALQHGDVVVWGGPARLAYHGILPLKDGEHPLVGRQRLNLTFRKAL
jgi:alkylated DNA repair protein (DNA oxidative demethylase)